MERPLLLLLLLAPGIRSEVIQTTRTVENSADSDEGEDSAAFMVVVEHGNGGRCVGSLVSVRTALTSAPCARLEGHRRSPLWVRARPGPARRVVRLAVSRGSTVDLALLELEKALGSPARPIVVASAAAECAAPASCLVVRDVSHRLRVVDEELMAASACAALVPRPLDDVLCLSGATLCPGARDGGAGVVCAGGKLCGVLGYSAGAGAGAEAGCGTWHVAAAVSRHRRFLKCAHRSGACARSGECEHLCTEDLLVDDEDILVTRSSTFVSSSISESLSVSNSLPVESVLPVSTLPFRTSSATGDAPWVLLSVESPVPSVHRAASLATRTVPDLTPSRSLAPARDAVETSIAVSHAERSVRREVEFEPNRPDFKPGEYGDVAAEYGGEEPASVARTAPPGAASPLAPTLVSPEIAARVSPAAVAEAAEAAGAVGGAGAAGGAGTPSGPVRAVLLPVAHLFLYKF